MAYDNKHILHVVNIYFVIPYFIGDQFKYFSQKGYKMFVACSPDDHLKSYAARQGFSYTEVPVNRSITIGQDLRTIRTLCRYIGRNNIGIVAGHTPKGALLAMTAGYLKRVPTRIYFRHGLVYETSHGLKRLMLKTVDRIASFCATKIVCVSPSVLRRSLEDRLAPANKQIVLGRGTCSGIDTYGKFNPANINSDKLARMKQGLGIRPGDIVIGYTGRLVRDKGITELLGAFDLLNRQDKRFRLLLVGMFEERDALPRAVQEEIRNNPAIVWTGFVDEGQEYYYAMMDVYVLMSYREGFPTGVLEAQSMEKPVVTTRATGCCDAIVEGRTGAFVEHDSELLKQKILEVLNGKQAGTMGKEARRWVVENFDNKHVWKLIETLY